MQYNNFKYALRDESVYPASENIYNYIIDTGERLQLKKNDFLIGYDEINDDIHFILDGIIRVSNHPYGESLKLESDYTLDFSNRVATCRAHSFSGDMALEVYQWDSNTQYVGDRVGLTLVPNNGVLELQPGIYKVNGSNDCAGRIIPGTFHSQTGAGAESVFVKYSDDEPGKVVKASGIKGGQLEVKKNSDGTWTLIYNLLDKQSPAKSITGIWTGNLKN